MSRVYDLFVENGNQRLNLESRPVFLNIVGRIVMNGGRRVIHLTSTHAEIGHSLPLERRRGRCGIIGEFAPLVRLLDPLEDPVGMSPVDVLVLLEPRVPRLRVDE